LATEPPAEPQVLSGVTTPSQGPRAKCGLACRTEAAADGEADNRQQSMRRSVARLGHIGRIAPEQPLKPKRRHITRIIQAGSDI